MDKRGKAYRLWTAYLKYVSRINRNLYYWRVKDENAPRGYRGAKNWMQTLNLKLNCIRKPLNLGVILGSIGILTKRLREHAESQKI